jgi:hypothetical protein
MPSPAMLEPSRDLIATSPVAPPHRAACTILASHHPRGKFFTSPDIELSRWLRPLKPLYDLGPRMLLPSESTFQHYPVFSTTRAAHQPHPTAGFHQYQQNCISPLHYTYQVITARIALGLGCKYNLRYRETPVTFVHLALLNYSG